MNQLLDLARIILEDKPGERNAIGRQLLEIIATSFFDFIIWGIVFSDDMAPSWL